jgi:hypothetical protein
VQDSQSGPTINRDTVRRFNLRGFNASLESIAEDIDNIRTARQVNIGSSWTKALQLLAETKEDIDGISVSRNLNLRSSWNKALASLSTTKEDIDTINATKNLNLRSSWNKALALLRETKEDIDSISASKNLNLRSSWNSFLTQLTEAKEDIDVSAAAKQVNLKASWSRFLSELQETKQDIDRLSQEKQIAEGRRIGGLNASPIQGGAAFPGSPAFIAAQRREFAERNRVSRQQELRQQQQRRQDLQGRISSGLIGGAFPLLFGQGPGAALGGLAGGVAGGGAFGFGASLVGTGLGASFDTLIARSKELAEALRDPLASFDQLKTASALSSRGLETYIDALIKSGQTAKAEQLIREDLTRNLNPVTAGALSQANEELARSFSDVQEKLSALLAGPAIAFLQWLDEVVDRLPIAGPGGAPGRLPTAAEGRATAQRGGIAQLAGAGLLISAGLIATLATGGLAAVPGAGLIAAGTASVGAGALAAGTAARASGERAPEDLDTQRRIASTVKEIEAVQARRISLQKQLVGFTGDEKSAAAQIAAGQNVVLTAQEAILQAKKTFLALPPDSSAQEEAVAYQAYKDAVAAARIEVEKLIATNNNQAKDLKRTTDLRERTTGFTSSARQGVELTDALERARKDYDKAKQATLSATSRDAIAAAEAVENKLGQAWRSAAQNLVDYNAELAFTAQRQAQINNLAAQKVAEDIKAVQAQRQLSQNAQRTAQFAIQESTLQTIQSIDAAVSEAKRRERDLGGQIDIARLRGDETLAADLVAQQKNAASQTRLELEKGADALTKASIQLREDVEAAFLNLQKLRTGEGGLNQFLSPQDRVNQEQKTFETLLPRFRQAQEQFKRLRGVETAPEFTGSRSGVNASILQFIEAVRTEQQAVDTSVDTQKALSDNTAALAKITGELQSTIAALNGKNWAVNVQVNADGSSQAYGDILAGAVSP